MLFYLPNGLMVTCDRGWEGFRDREIETFTQCFQVLVTITERIQR
jgi:hypothetical protein